MVDRPGSSSSASPSSPLFPTSDQTSVWVETGVPRLDLLLGGGLLSGSLVLVIGAPGAGKTVLAQQLASHLADQGRPTLYLTGYSEPHEKLIAHARSLRFFKPERIGQELQIANLLDLLRAGMDETQEAIVRAAASQHAALVVIDGFGGLRQLLPDEEAVTHFLYSLGAKLALLGATTLVLLEGEPDESARYPALSVCDVILALRSTADGERRSI